MIYFGKYFLTVMRKNPIGNLEAPFETIATMREMKEVKERLPDIIEMVREGGDYYKPNIYLHCYGANLPAGWNIVKRTAQAPWHHERNSWVCLWEFNVETQEEYDLVYLRTRGMKCWKDLP